MSDHFLRLHHLGPIQSCALSVNRFTVLTGPQSNGKSTIAKAVYFFRTVKQDILNLMMLGGPARAVGRSDVYWEYALKQRMRDKFLQLFGTSWIMPQDMEMSFSYSERFWLRVFLAPGQDEYGNRNYIDFEFSESFRDYLRELDTHSFDNITPGQKVYEEKTLSVKLNDPCETVFIPAGRNLITLLSTQLNYIFTALDELQLRSMDFITRRYTELILKLKPLFGNGMTGIVDLICNDPVQLQRYKKHSACTKLLTKIAGDVLRGTYRYVDGEERLYLDECKYIKINFASSGQQEIVWVFNLLFYYLLEDRRVFLILEEPESHLYPESQQAIGEVLAMFHNEGNAVLSTTHSPYLLGTFNYLLLAGQVPASRANPLKKILHKRYWLNPELAAAYYVHDGGMDQALDREDGMTLIRNSLIDGASHSINQKTDAIIELIDGED